MSEAKCRHCGILLNKHTQYPSSKRRGEDVCKNCKKEMFDNLAKNYAYGVTKDKYTIQKSSRSSTPHIRITENAEINPEIIFDLIRDTEKYRIHRMLKLLKKKDIKPIITRHILMYLLKSYRLLSSRVAALVINEVNKMFSSQDVPDNVAVAFAIEIRKYTGEQKPEKEIISDDVVDMESTNGKSYEELRQSGKEIEIETPEGVM